jgi:hypothetical protein
LTRFSPRLLLPVRHIHLAVHRRRDGEMFLRLPPIAHAAIELAKADVAVGDKRAHTQLLGQSEGRAVLSLGCFPIRRHSPGCRFREKAINPSRVALHPLSYSALQGGVGMRDCGLYIAGKQTGLTKLPEKESVTFSSK